MNDLDQLLDILASDVDTRPAGWRNINGMGAVRPVINPRKTVNHYTKAEHDFLVEQLQYLGVYECARILGRPVNSIHSYAIRHGILHPRHARGYLSGNVIARILGVDSHYPPCWMDRGIMPFERFPYPEESMWKRRIKIVLFKMWLIRPESWVYFDVEKMTDPAYQRLVKLAQARWGDEWWSTRQAADYLSTSPRSLLGYVKNHHLPAMHAVGLGRKRVQAWAFWFIPRSVVERIVWPKVRGAGPTDWSPGAQRFIVRARDEMGKGWGDIRRMMRTSATAWTIRNSYERWKRQDGRTWNEISKPPPLPFREGVKTITPGAMLRVDALPSVASPAKPGEGKKGEEQ